MNYIDEIINIISQQAQDDYYACDRCNSEKELFDKLIRKDKFKKAIYNFYWQECDKIREKNHS